MKRVLSLVVPFALAFSLALDVRADDKEITVKIEKKADGTVVAKDGEKEYAVSGEQAKTLEAGEYVVKGAVSQDGKSLEVKEAKKK